MTKNTCDSDSSLRFRTESLPDADETPDPEKTASGELHRLIHDLQAQQLELEKRNEELRRTREELALSQKHYVELYDQASAGYITIDSAGVVIRANQAAAELLGVTGKNMLTGHSITGFIHPDDTDIYSCHHKQSMATAIPINLELRMLHGNGSSIQVQLRSTTWSDGECRITLDDISGRNLAESARLRAREWELTFDAVPDLVAILDNNNRIMRVNRAMAQRLHLEPSQCIGLSCHSALRGTDIHPAFCQYLNSVADNPAVATEPQEILSDNNLLMTTTPIFDDRGNIYATVHVARDVSVLKQTEEERQRFVSLVEHSDEFIGMCDLQLVPFYANDSALRLVGLDTMAEARKINVRDFFYPEDLDFIENVFFPGVFRKGHNETEIRFRHFKTGAPVWMIYSVFYIRDMSGEPIALATVSRDITQRKEFEKRLQEHQNELKLRVKERTADLLATVETLQKEIIEREKTEAALREETLHRIKAVEEIRRQEHIMIHQNRHAAMGEMIANIAHQWRQPLNTLGLFTQQLGYFYGTPEFNREFLEESVAKSMEIIQYMSHTIDDFRNFFSTEREKSTFRAIDAVQMALSLVEASFRERDIHIKTVVNEDACIYGFPNEYAQVLLNIFVNARDELHVRNIESPQLLITIGAENGTSVVTIRDNAGGIPEDIIDRIFDPYFTTKGPQQGTGIGLFMSKTIIESNMGGSLTVKNTETGAEFRIAV